MLGALGVVRNLLQHDNDADPGSPTSYGIQNRFQPDFAAGAANMAAKPRFGPNSAPFAGAGKFNDVGGRFGPGADAGFDPMMRQRMLSQNLRGPSPMSAPPMQPPSPMPMAPPMASPMPQPQPQPQRMPQPGMGGGGFSQMMNRY